MKYINKLKGKTRRFSFACYHLIPLKELESNFITQNEMKKDCKFWGITTDQWLLAVKSAIYDRITGEKGKYHG